MKKCSFYDKSSSHKLIFTMALVLIWAGILGAGTRAFAQQPNGVAPPSGTSWVLTFDDEFTNDYDSNSIQTSYPPYGSLTTSDGTWTWGTNYGNTTCVPYYQYQNNPPYCSPNQWAILLNGSDAGVAGDEMELIGGQLYMSDGPSSYYVWQSGSWASTSDPSIGVGPVNSGVWNGGASNTDWCNADDYGRPGGTYMFAEDPNNPCGNYYDGLSLSSNGLSLESAGGPSAAITTSNTFLQEYGYWEASFEEPSANDGEGGVANHSDFWMHPIPEGDWGPEINVGERLAGYGSDASDTSINFSIHDDNGSGAYTDTGDCCGDDLSQGFHTYGLAWINDGSGPYGSMQIYLDGVPVYGSPWVLSSANTNLANGIYVFLSVDNDGIGYANPFNVQYVRIWQAE